MQGTGMRKMGSRMGNLKVETILNKAPNQLGRSPAPNMLSVWEVYSRSKQMGGPDLR